jgi:hypothetical protein
VARAADPDPARDRLRQPELWQDGARLIQLARELSVAELSPQLATALGRVVLTSGRDAVSLLTAAQARFPQDFWLNLELGHALSLAQRQDEALGYFRAALALRPQSSVTYCDLGIALCDIGRVDEAIDHYHQAIRLDPNYTVAHIHLANALGITFGTRRDWSQAAEGYAQALKRGPIDDGHFWFEYAALLLLSGDRPGYARACGQMIEKCGKPGGPRAYLVARACTLAPDAVAEASLPGRLADAFDAAPEGSVYVVNRYRDGRQNLRTHFLRIIRKAGVKTWGRLFHNLRGSLETELAQDHPVHVVAQWLGNTPKVALPITCKCGTATSSGRSQAAQKAAHWWRKKRRSHETRRMATIRTTPRKARRIRSGNAFLREMLEKPSIPDRSRTTPRNPEKNRKWRTKRCKIRCSFRPAHPLRTLILPG